METYPYLSCFAGRSPARLMTQLCWTVNNAYDRPEDHGQLSRERAREAALHGPTPDDTAANSPASTILLTHRSGFAAYTSALSTQHCRGCRPYPSANGRRALLSAAEDFKCGALDECSRKSWIKTPSVPR
eukprot:TRINITY_DN17412_c0_g1_i1.p1 TRINITY_DN17412_c0_g1~~TRINITY_DN17412_c0_g1_i1.p1  ORF type:complete len:130 (+),score=3.20 TRINITY_DN17412_c0_g1_i1:106-495(+)